MGQWPAQISRVQASVCSRPAHPINPHFNLWPCVKPCLVGGRGKYHQTKVSECSLNSFFVLVVSTGWLGQDAFQLAVSSGRQNRSGVSWLCGSRLRLPDASAREAQNSCLTAHTNILEPQEAILPGSNPLWRGYVYHLAPKAPFLKGMWTGLKAFLESLGVCGFWPCAWTYLKKRPFAILIWLVGHITTTREWQVYTQRRGMCTSPSSKLLNVRSASLPPANVESNQSHSQTQCSQYQLLTNLRCFLIQ